MVSTVCRIIDIEKINVTQSFVLLRGVTGSRSTQLQICVCPCMCRENMHPPQSRDSNPGLTNLTALQDQVPDAAPISLSRI